jgi:hypothetical protein
VPDREEPPRPAPTRSRADVVLSASAIDLGALLLFGVQPIIA